MEPDRDVRRPAPWKLVLGGLVLFAAGVGTGVLASQGSGSEETTVSAGAPAGGRETSAPISAPTSDDGGSGGASASTAPSPSAAPTTSLGVSAACVRAGEGGQQALEAVDAAGDAVADLDAQRLDEIIDALRPLRLSLPGDVAACRRTVAG